MPNALAVTLHATGAETSGGTGESVDIGAQRNALVIRGDVVALSGTAPVLGMEVQTSPDDSTWRFAYRIPDKTQADAFGEHYALGIARYVRAVWTVGGSGSPSVTFSLAGEAHVAYAGEQDSRLSSSQIKEAGPSVVAEKYVKACAMADGYLGNAFTMPLVSWGQDLRAAVAGIADYEIMCKRGFDPDGPDMVYMTNWKNSMAWLDKVATGRIKPAGIVDSTPEVIESGAFTRSRPKRGWVR